MDGVEINCYLCGRIIKFAKHRDVNPMKIKCYCAYCHTEIFDESRDYDYFKTYEYYTIEWND